MLILRYKRISCFRIAGCKTDPIYSGIFTLSYISFIFHSEMADLLLVHLNKLVEHNCFMTFGLSLKNSHQFLKHW